MISRLLSNSFSAFLKRIEAIPCFRCSGSTAIQQIMFFLCEKRRTPMIVPRLLTHNACFLFMNFSTVCSCSYIHSSVSSPGKFQLTFLTSCIHESIQELSPNTASISLPRKFKFIGLFNHIIRLQFIQEQPPQFKLRWLSTVLRTPPIRPGVFFVLTANDH